MPVKKEADEITVDSSAWRSEMVNDDVESQHSEEEQSTRIIKLNRSNTKS